MSADRITLLAGERQPGETGAQVMACNDYLRLGPGRTSRILYIKYQNQRFADRTWTPPASGQQQIVKWSKQFDWAGRAEQYDAIEDELRTQRRMEVLQSGVALDYERVAELKDLYEQVKAKLTLTEGVDANADRALAHLRGVLDDLAKETGGRKQKTELSGPDNSPVVAVLRGVSMDDL